MRNRREKYATDRKRKRLEASAYQTGRMMAQKSAGSLATCQRLKAERSALLLTPPLGAQSGLRLSGIKHGLCGGGSRRQERPKIRADFRWVLTHDRTAKISAEVRLFPTPGLSRSPATWPEVATMNLRRPAIAHGVHHGCRASH